MADRIFAYNADRATVHVELTARSTRHDGIQIEFTSEGFVNVAFPVTSAGPAWTSIYRGQELDDLIDVLTYYREEGYKGLAK
jgi:hypothetical protein